MSTLRSLCRTLSVALALALPATAATADPADKQAQADALPSNPLRDAYFGDLHLHTALSLDSYIFGNRNDPDTAYRFAQGETVSISGGEAKRLKHPLDFLAVTDHSEYMGELAVCTVPGTPQYDGEMCQGVRKGEMAQVMHIASTVSSPDRRHIAELCGADGDRCREGTKGIWKKVQEAAARAYKPGQFTSLIAWEFSPGVPPVGKPNPKNPTPGMMHRNVIFRTDHVPDTVFSAYDGSAEDLMKWLETNCTGPCSVMTIPHNSNFSWGRFFWEKNSDGTPWTQDILDRRIRLEQLVEIFQIKGGSECAAGFGLTDEECGFENASPPCPPGVTDDCAGPTSFVRDALVAGLDVADRRGVNPFKYGIIASTDNHNALAGGTAEDDYKGGHAQLDNTPQKRLAISPAPGADDGHGEAGFQALYNPGGLAGVWAEKNTREAIWDALKRRETFGTSGTRIRVRFFGGFDLPADLNRKPDLLKTGYAKGVPMGGDLAAAPAGKAPRFVVWATRDPDSAPLQKIQIVKGWIENGKGMSRVFDVVCADGIVPDSTTGQCRDNGATVDLATCAPSADKGAPELSATWSDPGFDAKARAVYYVRVLEDPVCRWSTWDAHRLKIDPPKGVPATVKERAWTSPIWYTPAGSGP
jgi:hypothetical protein